MIGVTPGVLCPDQSGDDEFRRTYYNASIAAAYPGPAKKLPAAASKASSPQLGFMGAQLRRGSGSR